MQIFPFLAPYRRFLSKHYSQLFATLLCILCCFGAGIKYYLVTERLAYTANFTYYAIDKNAFMRWKECVEHTIVSRPHIAQYKELLKSYTHYVENAPSTITASSSPIPTIVLIIDESTQRNYMGLYGYPLPTTPRLDILKENGNLVAFNNVIAPHSHTNLVLEKLLTFHNYENAQTPWYKQQNLIDILKLAGYTIHWLSNQEVVSIYGNAPEVISTRADITRFSTISDSYSAGKAYDEILLSLLQQVRQNEQILSPNTEAQSPQPSKNFYLFHLMGTHLGYDGRYPKSFETFNIDTLKQYNLHTLTPYPHTSSTILNPRQLQIKAHYINAILYNDYVVNAIIESFKDEDALIFYISDHGDEVYDFRDFVGHSENIGSRFMIEVPFMVYMSDSFRESYPHIAQKIEKAKDLPFMSNDFIHAFLDVLNINYTGYNPTRSLFNPLFNDKRARIFAGKDYDRDMRDEGLLQNALFPSKLWLHRVDETQKLIDFKDKYKGFEIDVHFLLAPVPHFDVGHDGLESSIGLKLEDMLKLMQDSIKSNGWVEGISDFPYRIWLDFKNLQSTNAASALKVLESLCKTYAIPHSTFIVESGNYEDLGIFKKAGFFTSYYVPYYKQEELKTQKEEVIEHLKAIIKSGNVYALSFPYYLYHFIKDAHLGYFDGIEWIDMPLLTWNEGQSPQQNMQTEAYFDPQIKVILVGEKGEYR
ncbi:phosphoethanolamine transferase [uncultured Helicobacter sp.]|uniref:phosphoethanolamine transferase n=2 Tax=uncultured Helicobacter sp. TaxID=175537 RepID=UPI0025CE0BCE|nr:phosphoethanolamine transferase [uncultured Helicobacter sp.]